MYVVDNFLTVFLEKKIKTWDAISLLEKISCVRIIILSDFLSSLKILVIQSLWVNLIVWLISFCWILIYQGGMDWFSLLAFIALDSDNYACNLEVQLYRGDNWVVNMLLIPAPIHCFCCPSCEMHLATLCLTMSTTKDFRGLFFWLLVSSFYPSLRWFVISLNLFRLCKCSSEPFSWCVA